jgi:hypothetical protein
MASKLVWYGEQISARVREASREAIDETMAACVEAAAPRFPGGAEGKPGKSVDTLERAKWEPVRKATVGIWGSRYFLAHIFEVGSSRHRRGWTIKNAPKGGKHVLASPTAIYGRRTHHPPIPEYAPLRRTADFIYPTLAIRVARRLFR